MKPPHPGEEHEDLKEYADHLRASGDVKESSIYARLSYLRRLREAYGKPLDQLTAREIESWLAGLGVSPSTLRTVLVYVRHALKVLNGGEAPDLAKRIPKPKKGAATVSRIKTPAELLTEDEVETLVAAFTKKDLSAITALLYGLGARPSDVLRLRREDLTILERGGVPFVEAQIRDSKGRPRTSYTAKPLVVRAVRDWLRAHPGGEILFPSPHGGQRSEAAFGITLKRAAERAGLTKNVYPYLLRHVRATELYDLPAPVRDAQMGWVPGSKMWSNYTHLRSEEVRDAILEREGVEAEELTEDEAKEILGRLLVKVTEEPAFADKLRGMLGG